MILTKALKQQFAPVHDYAMTPTLQNFFVTKAWTSTSAPPSVSQIAYRQQSMTRAKTDAVFQCVFVPLLWFCREIVV